MSVVICLFALPARAGRIRVTTWNMHLSASAAKAAEATGAPMQTVAEFLRSLDSDVLLLQEVCDREVCENLVQLLGSESYQLLVVSDFAQGASGDGRKKQIAIVAKHAAVAVAAEEWQTGGALDLPGGFVRAVVRIGQHNLGFFCVHLKNNSTRGNYLRDNQLNIFKRESAAAHLIERVKAIESEKSPRLDAVVVGGDFNTSPDQSRFVSEQTLGLLRDAHLQDVFDGLAASERVTCPGRGRYADVTFDYIFVNNAELRAEPTIMRTNLSDHFPVTCELELKEVTPPLAVTTPAPPATTEDIALTPTGVPATIPVASAPPTALPGKEGAPWLLALALLLGIGGFACWRWSLK